MRRKSGQINIDNFLKEIKSVNEDLLPEFLRSKQNVYYYVLFDKTNDIFAVSELLYFFNQVDEDFSRDITINLAHLIRNIIDQSINSIKIRDAIINFEKIDFELFQEFRERAIRRLELAIPYEKDILNLASLLISTSNLVLPYASNLQNEILNRTTVVYEQTEDLLLIAKSLEMIAEWDSLKTFDLLVDISPELSKRIISSNIVEVLDFIILIGNSNILVVKMLLSLIKKELLIKIEEHKLNEKELAYFKTNLRSMRDLLYSAINNNEEALVTLIHDFHEIPI